MRAGAAPSIDHLNLLCVPSVHAKYRSEEMIVDFGGSVREKSDHFPENKAKLVAEWVNLHKEETNFSLWRYRNL